jgi:hypothetical protein
MGDGHMINLEMVIALVTDRNNYRHMITTIHWLISTTY